MDADFCTLCTGMSTDPGSAETEPLCVCSTGCFPATAEIELSSGVKQMGSIAVGDKAHVGSSQYSDIYYFSTAMEDTMSKFVSLATSDTKKPLLLTPGNKIVDPMILLALGRHHISYCHFDSPAPTFVYVFL
jgi:hypothetical protein